MDNIDQYRIVHQESEKYGTGLTFHLPYLAALLVLIGAKSVLNFGCGKSLLGELLISYGVEKKYDYEPAIPELSHLPNETFDALINTDVLEHIPEGELDKVLTLFKTISRTSINIPDMQKARLILPNGENAHCTLKSPEQWQAIFQKHYKHVCVLPHHSKRHTTIFATDENIDLGQVKNLIDVVIFTRKEYTLKNFGMTQPFRRRLRAAVRLLRGNSGFLNKKY